MLLALMEELALQGCCCCEAARMQDCCHRAVSLDIVPAARCPDVTVRAITSLAAVRVCG